MSEHAAQAHNSSAGHSSSAPVAGELRFEKSELDEFVTEDQECGKAIGKLLAATFCVLVVLMTGVVFWINKHQSVGHDPMHVPTTAASTPGH